MKFYFCEGCGKRITDKDIDAGLGKNKKLKGVYCKGCAAGVMTMETLPLTDEAAQSILKSSTPSPSEPRTASTKTRNRRTSAYSIPPAKTRSSLPPSRQQPLDSPQRSNESRGNPTLAIALLGGLASITLVVAFALSSTPKPLPTTKPQAEKPQTIQPPADTIQPLPPIAALSSTPAPSPSPPSTPQETEKPQPLKPDPLQHLETTLAGLAADAFEARVKLVEDFLAEHPEHDSAPHLSKQKNEWRKKLESQKTVESPPIKLPLGSDPNNEKPPSKPPAHHTVNALPKEPAKASAPPYEALCFKHLDGLIEALRANDFERTKSLAAAMAADSNLGRWQDALQTTPAVVAIFPKQCKERLARLEKFIGRKIDLQTAEGQRKGTLAKLNATELTLQTRFVINGKEKVGTTFSIPMRSIKAESLARYAKASPPNQPMEWIAAALRAFADNALPTAKAALDKGTAHPLTGPMKKYLAQKEAQMREQNAQTAWAKLLRRSDSATTTKQVEKLQADLVAYESAFRDTAFAGEHKKDLEKLRLNLEKRTLRSRRLIAALFHGHIADYDIKTGIVKLSYDFKQKEQGHDFIFSNTTTPSVGNGALTLTGDQDAPLRCYTDRFDLDAFELTFTFNMSKIRKKYSWGMLTLGKAHSLALVFLGSSIALQRRVDKPSNDPHKGFQTLHRSNVDGSADVKISLRRENGNFELSLNGKQVHTTSGKIALSYHRISWLTRKGTDLQLKDFTFKGSPNRTWLKEQVLFQSMRERLSGPVNIWMGKSGKWIDPASWSLQRPPRPGDHVVFDRTATADCNATAGAVASLLGSLTLTPGYSGHLSFAPGFGPGKSQTLEVSGPILALGGKWSVMGKIKGSENKATGEGVTIKAKRFILGVSGMVHSDGGGFPPLSGPYVGIGHGYRQGDPRAPETLGSSTKGGAGGGAIKIDVATGQIMINGTLSADAKMIANSHVVGSSGGSLYLIGGRLEGAGRIRANAADGIGDGHGGEGGRIAVNVESLEFMGSFECKGGMTGGGRNTKSGRPGSLVLPSKANLTVTSAVGLPPGLHTFNNLIIRKGGTLTCHPDPQKGTGVHLETSTLTIEAGGHLSADKEGDPALKKAQTRPERTAPGKSDQPAAPFAIGLAGLGCWGGGAIRIDSQQAVVNGTLSANGESPLISFRYGGCGGSIWLNCESLNGHGTIQADGGKARGSGGQIAIYYRKGMFEGTTSAKGTGTKNDGTVLVNGKLAPKQ